MTSAPIKPEQPFSLVIPVYNEESRLARNGADLIAYIEDAPSGSMIVLVDDGSSDSTTSQARSLQERSSRVALYSRPHLGKGAAVAFGLGSIETPLAGYTDVDLSTPLHEVDRLLAIASTTDSLVIGSRGVDSSQVEKHQSGLRERLGRTFNVLVRSTISPGIYDTQCGAKFARLGTWRTILEHTRDPGFAWESEAVAVAQRLGLGVEEVGIEWSHDPMTRVDVVGDGIRMAWSVLRMTPRLRRLERSQVKEKFSNPHPIVNSTTDG